MSKLSRAVVLCTLPLHPTGRALLEPVADVVDAPDTRADSLVRLIRDADYLIVRTALPPDIFEHPHRLRGIVRHGSGLDMIPMESATSQGIPVANVPGANAQAVAEYVVASLFSLARRGGQMDAALRAQDWTAARSMSGGTVELAGKTIGIVGLGDIGKRIAHTCHAGLGMNVIGYQPDASRFPSFVRSETLDALLAQSDFVSLNCPLTPTTRHLIDSRRMGLMKKTAFIVNAARGEVIDEAALALALSHRAIAGAALDVYAEQPIPRTHPFFSLDNVLLTPHVAALTQESYEKMSVGTALQILQLMRGQRPTHFVNPEVWAKWPFRMDHAMTEHRE
jgi:D-3-phosphoglycerate dehydrogenase / 2-oxoglutarate reductase